MRLLGSIAMCIKYQGTLIRLKPSLAIDRATNHAYNRNTHTSTFASRYYHVTHVYIIENI